MAPPGILYVTMQPKPGLAPAQFHDWYNNEHGPGRQRFPKIFENGFRYRALDLPGPDQGSAELPEWMAIYDVTDMDEMVKEPYVSLRQAPIQSQRERDTMKQITVDRKFYDLTHSDQSDDFKRLENIQCEGEENVIVAIYLRIHAEKCEELNKWYAEEHIPLIGKIPGWRRTRRFVTAGIDNASDENTWYLALHEFTSIDGLSSAEFKTAVSTKWYNEIATNVVKENKRRMYKLAYTFGPAPRDISNLTEPFTSHNEKTKEFPSEGAIESYITTPDGVEIAYRLEGSHDPDAPLIVLSSSVLVTWGIWDGFVAAFNLKSKYRILRYLTRGRTSDCGTESITIDSLANDIVTLLDALRVKTAACVIGVSMGGATAMNVALKHPTRVHSFISCDTSSKSPAGNSKAWGERIAMAEKEGAKASSGEEIIGEELAEATVRRWFAKESYDGSTLEERIGEVKKMVATNSLPGFRKSVEALFEYDMKEEVRAYKGKGMYVVGGSDGVLPKSMKEMAGELGGKGTKCAVIELAGHLPMVEKPEEFARIVDFFLEQ